jgi:hypothetical protein
MFLKDCTTWKQIFGGAGKRARSGLSLRKAAHGEATFHARPHCVIQCVECLRTLKPEKSLGQHVVLSLPRDSYVVTRSRPYPC